MTCATCGEDEATCRDARAALAREPWLPGGFELGAQWQSLDGGETWHRFNLPIPAPGRVERRMHMTVVAIDPAAGTVTIKAA